MSENRPINEVAVDRRDEKEFPNYYTRLDQLEARRTSIRRRAADAHNRLRSRSIRYKKKSRVPTP